MRCLKQLIFILFLIFTVDIVQAQQSGVSNEMAQQTTTMGQKLKSTGMTGLALLAISIFSLSIALERMKNLQKDKISPNGLTSEMRQLWSKEQFDEIEQLCQKNSSTLCRIVQHLVAYRHSNLNDVSTIAGDISSRELKMHLYRAYPLAIAATISPLLGLFGTVYGMIGAFETVAQAGEMGNPAIMAESISYALMTTAIGLIIAVPSLAAYHYFRTRTNIFALALEKQINELILEWFMKKEAQNAN
jgi:biopolymer transport protein ExbB